MNITRDLYKSSLALLTDLYQLTMAYGYWKSGISEKEASFNLHFRNNPFNGGFSIACGLQYAIDLIENFRFSDEDLVYLSDLTGHDGSPLFHPEFLDYLKELEMSCDIDAIPEGTLVFPQEPLIRVSGALLQCQLLETPLLNVINFQTLIATKSARVNIAAEGDPVMEFGLRRAQGIDGGLAASRSAYIGGCSSTSNVLAGKVFGIPVTGTHAHSWVMSFDNEMESFRSYARALPNNCVFLVDTYDTIQGIRNAIEMGLVLRENDQKLLGVRIDSGDLAYFSQKARSMLDEAGFSETKIIASSDLDETIISSLKQQDSAIDTWGVGTKLVTGFNQPALGAVYKLTAIRDSPEVPWQYRIKLSEQAVKINNPGIQQVRRFSSGGRMTADMIYNTENPAPDTCKIVDPKDPTRSKVLDQKSYQFEDLLQSIFQGGKRVYESPPLSEIRQKVIDGVSGLDKSMKRFVNPHEYVVGLEQSLFDLKMDIIYRLRKERTVAWKP